MKNELLERLNQALKDAVRKGEALDQDLWDSMAYSLMAGGKRIRPVLLLLTGLSLGANEEDLMPFATALEMVHTYSLIHDDLPAMDDDDYRRGRLTNHKVFGEGKAILAGDGLLTLAFETMGAAMKASALEGRADKVVRQALAMEYLARSAGCKGMIAGQIADLNSEGKSIDLEELTYIEMEKTSRLLMASLCMGSLLAGAKERVTDALERAGRKVGLAFQIQDDILDAEGTLETLGKMPGNDAKNAKPTFVSLYGLETAKKKALELTEEAMTDLAVLEGPQGQEVRDIVRSLCERKE